MRFLAATFVPQVCACPTLLRYPSAKEEVENSVPRSSFRWLSMGVTDKVQAFRS
ncbi:hypothetical protein M413DRAFT_448740 [Hebeloma cylindrosporum]|uniref:Uncharacterized protein n=1 Tax=Hebeloma cylindrosporum TaxID=76867 RepID=A0A0C3BJU3_HEBCY|nr:hypothetical protein M413DRAFT_448740 [Hebeloma cylindrosporum h7]